MPTFKRRESMSLIIAYVGKKGCVMAGDKRRIAYFGSKEERELLEQEIYTGEITSDEELYARAEELGISLKVTDDATKVKSVENVAVGEVSSRGTMETKRKRIYGTTNGFQIIELTGSEIVNSKKGESSIIVFGNKITKSLANEMLKKRWKPSFSLKYMGDIFGQIIDDISKKTPSLGTKYDVVIQQNNLSKDKVQDYLDEVIERDVNLLAKFRTKLREDLLKQNETIKLALLRLMHKTSFSITTWSFNNASSSPSTNMITFSPGFARSFQLMSNALTSGFNFT